MIIKSKNISLRTISDDDTTLILKWRNNSDVRKNFIFQKSLTKENHTTWLKEKVYKGNTVQFIIIENISQTPIGSVYLRDIDRLNNKAEFGIFLGESKFRGKKLGQESTRCIVQYGFSKLMLNKIFLRVFKENLSAIKCYKNCGFLEDGTFREDVLVDGKYRDIVFMSILKAEWNELL